MHQLHLPNGIIFKEYEAKDNVDPFSDVGVAYILSQLEEELTKILIEVVQQLIISHDKPVAQAKDLNLCEEVSEGKNIVNISFFF